MGKGRRKFLQQLIGVSGAAGLSAVPSLSHASAPKAQVKDIRLSKSDGYVRLVFDMDRSVQHSIFSLHQPERIVLDLKNASMPHGMIDMIQANSLIRGIRSGIQNGHDLRVVFDLHEQVSPRSFILTPSGEAGHRLVLDLHDSEKKSEKIVSKKAPKKELRDVVIVIDAGHGGRDPGATGRKGTKEKTVTLQMARKLEKLINNQRGMKAVLTRKDDRYMKLRHRIEKARKSNADMMISIHADSFPDPRARGSSIFALSVNGASSEMAQQLAENENASDVMFGDVSLTNDDPMVNKVLLDLSFTGGIESSLDIGDEVLKQIGTVNKVHKKTVQQAGFAVLKTPNIPSVLLETAFISNPREEKNLRSSAHQLKVAKAISRGVNSYFLRKAPPGTWLSEAITDYKVKPGDNLAVIANRFNTSVDNLRARNALQSNNLNAGQVLKIPVS
ncbi:MAG: N-acetylmuramoyl-L-alanine amidase [Gammaproteobacteria bacterium]|nr:N-acetylmuramoyl-L-alanine amidase [Gammaproteobacteria bacterium]